MCESGQHRHQWYQAVSVAAYPLYPLSKYPYPLAQSQVRSGLCLKKGDSKYRRSITAISTSNRRQQSRENFPHNHAAAPPTRHSPRGFGGSVRRDPPDTRRRRDSCFCGDNAVRHTPATGGRPLARNFEDIRVWDVRRVGLCFPRRCCKSERNVLRHEVAFSFQCSNDSSTHNFEYSRHF